jgi:hypothetical protein
MGQNRSETQGNHRSGILKYMKHFKLNEKYKYLYLNCVPAARCKYILEY